ncbi:LOW QUALITY PROTEIN: NDR1/HIN1-like protein 12 [Eutrema salsugineum]|uniref:LOW QUALITY PROTEIN: NDR1/HIN1-like protein 12 n=1 Tax=Eutrema salsugineum TaxID=72664 RepID=UPI000CED1B4C|nr:LOW QUALITY PROTEIN: NDR1/HIN1-like protein 12 [Eutrema salsugineum]
MSKDCEKHGGGDGGEGVATRICGAIIGFIIIVLITIFLVLIILRPTKPRFILQDASVFAFNLSQPKLLTSNLQVRIATHNPNSRIEIYYDRLHVYATYWNQQITLRTAIPPKYQGHKEDNVWSPFIYALALGDEQNRGFVALIIRADGRVRWKVGTLITGKYHLHVRCPSYISATSRTVKRH